MSHIPKFLLIIIIISRSDGGGFNECRSPSDPDPPDRSLGMRKSEIEREEGLGGKVKVRPGDRFTIESLLVGIWIRKCFMYRKRGSGLMDAAALTKKKKRRNPLEMSLCECLIGKGNAAKNYN